MDTFYGLLYGGIVCTQKDLSTIWFAIIQPHTFDPVLTDFCERLFLTLHTRQTIISFAMSACE